MDRRFYGRKYDAVKTLEGFSANLRDETDLDALNDELVRVVSGNHAAGPRGPVAASRGGAEGRMSGLKRLYSSYVLEGFFPELRAGRVLESSP